MSTPYHFATGNGQGVGIILFSGSRILTKKTLRIFENIQFFVNFHKNTIVMTKNEKKLLSHKGFYDF